MNGSGECDRQGVITLSPTNPILLLCSLRRSSGPHKRISPMCENMTNSDP
jgi:hypothetical protein